MLRYHCPGAPVIERLMLGYGEELEVQLFEEHLQQCDDCFKTLQRLKVEDPLVKALETAGPVQAGMPPDAVLQPLVDRLCRLPEELPDERPGHVHDDQTDRTER